MLCFLYVVGLVSGCSSVVQMSQLAGRDALLELMFKPYALAQYTLSRFFTTPFAWRTFGKKRVARLQADRETALQEGDVINLDDTHSAHPYAKKLPFLCWLRDSSTKTYSWCMNLVVLQAVLQSGLEYPLFYSVWRKVENDEGLSKFDLAMQMLLQLRETVSCRLWVAMDRWYLKKEFFVFLQHHDYDWVTKAKRNTALFRKTAEPGRRERYVPVSARQLIREAYKRLAASENGLSAIVLTDIYMKLPRATVGRRGQPVTKDRLEPIAAIVATRLKEDEEERIEGNGDDDTATYKGAYLIISNRHDAPTQALKVYGKRWRVEVFFRAAKQELGFEQCHSTSESHQHAHMELLFATETLLAYALWQLNKEKTSDDEGCTHGEMVRCLFHTRCQISRNTRKGIQRIYVDFDIETKRFASFISAYWPKSIHMTWWPVSVSMDSVGFQLFQRSA